MKLIFKAFRTAFYARGQRSVGGKRSDPLLATSWVARRDEARTDRLNELKSHNPHVSKVQKNLRKFFFWKYSRRVAFWLDNL